MLNVIIRTVLHLKKGSFENLTLFLKMPPSDLRQKVQLTPYKIPYEEIAERWSAIHKFTIPYSAFQPTPFNNDINHEFNEKSALKYIITTNLMEITQYIV